MARKEQELRTSEMYESQLALFRKGCRGTGWAARKFLGVDEGCYAGDIIAKVYEGLDQLDQLADQEQAEQGAALITAGAILLRFAPAV